MTTRPEAGFGWADARAAYVAASNQFERAQESHWRVMDAYAHRRPAFPQGLKESLWENGGFELFGYDDFTGEIITQTLRSAGAGAAEIEWALGEHEAWETGCKAVAAELGLGRSETDRNRLSHLREAAFRLLMAAPAGSVGELADKLGLAARYSDDPDLAQLARDAEALSAFRPGPRAA